MPNGRFKQGVFKKLRLGEREIAIVDMEAGVEHFGRGIDETIDKLLVVVEPSFDSLWKTSFPQRAWRLSELFPGTKRYLRHALPGMPRIRERRLKQVQVYWTGSFRYSAAGKKQGSFMCLSTVCMHVDDTDQE
ncbi:MAG: hypothetical protein ACLFUN_10050, partial [Desulfobacterales bacterium]